MDKRREFDELDCWNADNPVCPHCGEVFHLREHDRSLDVSYEEGGQTDWTCDSCSKPFVSVTVIEYKYCTAVDEERANEEQWGPQEAAEPELETCQQ